MNGAPCAAAALARKLQRRFARLWVSRWGARSYLSMEAERVRSGLMRCHVKVRKATLVTASTHHGERLVVSMETT